MYPAGFFRGWNTLNAMSAGFIFESFIAALPVYTADDRVVAADGARRGIGNTKTPALLQGVFLILSDQMTSKNRGFIATGAGPHFKIDFIKRFIFHLFIIP